MSKFTYENKTKNSPLETYEWDNVWWEQTDNLSSKRVAYIGDSISCAVRHVATALSDNAILFDGFGTSKALDNPCYIETLKIFLKQEQKLNAVLFNNGLHGWHLTDDQYEAKYREMLEFLTSVSKAPVFVVLTTDVPNDEARNNAVIKRNKIAKKLAKEFNLLTVDLYSVAKAHFDLHIDENDVHFTQEGYSLLAKHILNELQTKI